MHHTHHLGGWFAVIILAAILFLAFEVWMFIDVITNENISRTAKIWWIVGMLFIHPIVAAVYFFTDHRKR